MQARFFAPLAAILGLVALSALGEETSKEAQPPSDTAAIGDSADSPAPAEESPAAPEAAPPDEESAAPVESEQPQQ